MVLAFSEGVVLEHKLSEEERNQIAQTIEMFEAITQSVADDYQSLEILKEAYQKLGAQADWLRTSRRLAEAYFNAGSYALAMQECEAVLVKEPNAPEILAMLGEIETRLQATGQTTGAQTGLMVSPNAAGLSSNGGKGSAQAGLIDMKGAHDPSLQDRGDEHLAKFLVMRQLFPEEDVRRAVETTKILNKDIGSQGLATSLLEQLCQQDSEKMDLVLSQLIDRTKFAYMPLEDYDVDRQVARMLPDHLTISRLFVPFDLVSRTIMVACCNPFDAAGREAVQQSLDYTVAWYLSRPSALVKNLQDIYRIEARV